MVKDKMLVCFTVDKTALGTSQITDLTLNMSVIYEDGHRTERQATDPKVSFQIYFIRRKIRIKTKFAFKNFNNIVNCYIYS